MESGGRGPGGRPPSSPLHAPAPAGSVGTPPSLGQPAARSCWRGAGGCSACSRTSARATPRPWPNGTLLFRYCGLEPDVVEALGRRNFSAGPDRRALKVRSVSVATSGSGFSRAQRVRRGAVGGGAGGAGAQRHLGGRGTAHHQVAVHLQEGRAGARPGAAGPRVTGTGDPGQVRPRARGGCL